MESMDRNLTVIANQLEVAVEMIIEEVLRQISFVVCFLTSMNSNLK
jgi:hypothetical protein